MIKLQPKNPIFIDFLLYLVISPNNSGVSWHINLLKGKIWQGIDFTEYSSGDNVLFFWMILIFTFPLSFSCYIMYLVISSICVLSCPYHAKVHQQQQSQLETRFSSLLSHMTHQEPSAVIYIPAYALLKGRCFCAPVCRLYVIAHVPFVT